MMYGLNFTFSCFLVFLSFLNCGEGTLSRGLGSEDEVRLVRDLFEKSGYNPLIRPVKNISDSIEVQFNLALSQLINVDEKNQVMKTNVWLQMYWYDYQLKWNPELYGGIKTIRLSHKKAWRPDIVLFNNADGKYEVTYQSNVVLGEEENETYNIYFIPPAIYQSSCEIDVEYFPFDEQICEMKFGSWTFQADQLNFTYYKFSGLDLTDYLKSGTWDIIECPSRIEICTDPNNGQAKAIYIAKIKIRRKTLFYSVNLIIPCILISFVSICVFMLPADAGEKITLIISVLLALVVFLLLISKMLPPSLTIPLIAKYLLFTFIMNIIAIGSTVFVINRNYRTPRTHRMPNWVRIVFLNYLPKILLMERPDHDTRWQKPDDVKELQKISSSLQSMTNFALNKTTVPANILELTTIHHPGCQLDQLTSSGQENDIIDKQFPLSPELLKATEAIRFITEHLHSEDRYDMISNDWKYVAAVIDRLLLCIFLIVTICGTLLIIMQAPHIFDNVDQDQIIRDLMQEYDLLKNPQGSTPPVHRLAPC